MKPFLRSLLVPITVLLLILSGSTLIYLRHTYLGVPLSSHAPADSWELELFVTGRSSGKAAKVEIRLPMHRHYYSIVDQSFSSPNYSLAIIKAGDEMVATLSHKKPTGREQAFSYSIRLKGTNSLQGKLQNPENETGLTPEQREVLHKIKRDLKKNLAAEKLHEGLLELLFAKSDVRLASLAFLDNFAVRLAALDYLGYRGRYLYGLFLDEGKSHERLSRFLELQVPESEGGGLILFRPSTRRIVPHNRVFLWGPEADPLRSADGLSDVQWSVTSVPVRSIYPYKAYRKKNGLLKPLSAFALHHLPLKTQVTFRVLLLLPLAALVVSFARNVIGLRTFGTFMPALVAMSFRETGVWAGLTLFSMVVTVGVILRYFFREFRLLLVPRLASVLTVVVLLILTFALVGTHLGFPVASAVALFPVVIITMSIERINVSLEEAGLWSTAILLFNTVLSALMAFSIITNETIGYLFLAFPELNLFVLAGSVSLGRYSGFRLVELYRFRSLAKQPASTDGGK